MRHRRKAVVVAALLTLSLLPLASTPPATALPNPVATDEITYTAFGRVWPDPHGCIDEVGGVLPKGVSPWAKGNACAVQFLQYEEVIEGARFLERHMRAEGFPYLRVINLQEAYDNPNYRSAGIPRTIAFEDGLAKLFSRDRRPLYLFKVTDPSSPVPESEKQHFAYSLSVHGIERAGLEGGIRAMEDLVTWAACEEDASVAPACAAEGIGPGNPKPIIETPVPEGTQVPTAGEVLDNAVIWFFDPNPDGWARGQVAPAEFENGAPNASYAPGFFFQRYNGNGVDVNRDWPTIGYTFRPYSPGSEPETKTYAEVLSGIRNETLDGEPFAGGIDLHGMITAYAFSYTLLGAGQRDFRKNALTVETSIRAWRDQTQRLAWSPYVADPDADGENEAEAGCFGRGQSVPLLTEGGTRGRIPACVADQWGTVIDTIGYQITGGIGDWIDSPLGLDGIGIDNEMYASHFAPNTVYEPALEQTHIDGNKGLIYSQLAAMLTANEPRLELGGRVGYVYNPNRLQVAGQDRPPVPQLPAQNDIEAMLPCQSVVQPGLEPAGCKEGTFTPSGAGAAYEFQVRGPQEGVWNGGLTTTYRGANVNGVGVANSVGMQLQHFDEGQWHTVAYHFRQGAGAATSPGTISPDLYLPTGQIATVNDPEPGRWRVFFSNAMALPGRLTVDFTRAPAEPGDGQAEVDASSMDFFPEQNQYVQGEEMQAVLVADILANPDVLDAYDTIVLVNNMGSPQYLRTALGLSQKQIDAFFLALRNWVRDDGGNLVVTDAALQAVPRINKNLPASAVRTDDPFAKSTAVATSPSRAPAGSYYFNIGNTITYENPDQYPLARDVDKPGAAELERGRRQAAEPVPLGYTPDPGYDITPAMPVWGIDRAAWEATCRQPNCVTALSNPMDVDPGPGTNRQQHVSIGEMRFGAGTIRTAGVMFPDPVYQPDNMNDHRYGISDYALTWTAYEVFQNLVDPTP